MPIFNKKFFKIFVMLLLLFFAFFIFLSAACRVRIDGEENKKEAQGKEEKKVEITAPDFLLEDLEGEKRRLSDFKGNIVIISFWATWCPYCVRELEHLQEVYLSERDVAVLAVNVGESKSRVQKFMEEKGFTFPVLLDKEMEVSRRYQIRGLPTTFLLDEQLSVVAIKIGAFDKAELERLIQSARQN